MSSSYDAAMVDTKMIEDPRLLALPRGVRLLYLEALVWMKLHRTDGHLPAGALPRVTDEDDPRQAAARLVEAELWTMTDNGWAMPIEEYSASQWTKSQVEGRIKSQRDARERYDEKNPDRPRRGRHGRTDVSRERSDDTSGDGIDRPTDRPTERSEGVGGGRHGASAKNGAAPASTGTAKDGRPRELVAAELRAEFPDRYAHETLEGHLGGGR